MDPYRIRDRMRSLIDMAESSNAASIHCTARDAAGRPVAVAVYIEDPEKAAVLDRLLTQWEKE